MDTLDGKVLFIMEGVLTYNNSAGNLEAEVCPWWHHKYYFSGRIHMRALLYPVSLWLEFDFIEFISSKEHLL